MLSISHQNNTLEVIALFSVTGLVHWLALMLSPFFLKLVDF